ncbi:hypothetical protein MUG78_17790 [Gordonia alkaliphila]|uniref:hypothetical protein n=1 Tax=Gordonia alkaliphila TaxID=1053547 RepID=UPI001FF6ACCF|nr:hypothetical protein [Gordonia alkaliphila]MCK0441254.1 hypothetical protein [Gordonia alkaliphila]
MAVGDRLTADEAAEYLDHLGGADVVLIWGADWDGNPMPRAIRSTTVSALIGKFGERFDLHGPQATLCGECGELLVSGRGESLVTMQQNHLFREHKISAPLLP